MGCKPPQVRDLWLLNSQADGRDLCLDTPAWFSWLESPTSTSFAYPLFDPQQGCIVGLMTVRKDGRQRGGQYWSVFRRQGQHIRRIYLGGSNSVTGARLEGIAQQLLQETSEQAQPA